MTVRQAIRCADELRPNALSDENKRFWLAQLDGVLRREVLGWHEENAAKEPQGSATALAAGAAQAGRAVQADAAQAAGGNTAAAPAGADTATADDTLLLAPEPYSGVYLYWLMAQIDLTVGELTRYANDMALYNNSLNAFAVRYKAEHRPRPRGQFLL